MVITGEGFASAMIDRRACDLDNSRPEKCVHAANVVASTSLSGYADLQAPGTHPCTAELGIAILARQCRLACVQVV